MGLAWGELRLGVGGLFWDVGGCGLGLELEIGLHRIIIRESPGTRTLLLLPFASMFWEMAAMGRNQTWRVRHNNFGEKKLLILMEIVAFDATCT